MLERPREDRPPSRIGNVRFAIRSLVSASLHLMVRWRCKSRIGSAPGGDGQVWKQSIDALSPILGLVRPPSMDVLLDSGCTTRPPKVSGSTWKSALVARPLGFARNAAEEALRRQRSQYW